jgi:hypothetical protein
MDKIKKNIAEFTLGIGIVIVFSFISYQVGFNHGQLDIIEFIELKLNK